MLCWYLVSTKRRQV